MPAETANIWLQHFSYIRFKDKDAASQIAVPYLGLSNLYFAMKNAIISGFCYEKGLTLLSNVPNRNLQ